MRTLSISFRLPRKRVGKANAWLLNSFSADGLKWGCLWGQTFYTLSKPFLLVDNPAWRQANFYYKAGKYFTMETIILCSIWKVLAGLSVLEITILLNCIQCFRVHKKCFLSRLRPEKAWTAVLNIYNLLTTILTP